MDLTKYDRDQLKYKRRMYYAGDTWQYWIGPLPLGLSEADEEARRSVRKIFQRSNKIKECVDRLVNSLVGKDPHYSVANKNQKENDEKVSGGGSRFTGTRDGFRSSNDGNFGRFFGDGSPSVVNDGQRAKPGFVGGKNGNGQNKTNVKSSRSNVTQGSSDDTSGFRGFNDGGLQSYGTGTDGSSEQSQLVDELNDRLQDWFKANSRLSVSMRDVVSPPLWEAVKDMIVEGDGFLRLWMPNALADKEGIDAVMMSRVNPDAVAVEYDDDGFVKRYTINTSGGVEIQELITASGDEFGNDTIAGKSSTDGSVEPTPISQCRLRVTMNGVETVYAEFQGTFLIAHLNAHSSIHDDVMDAQNAINLVRTMACRALIQTGFMELLLTNTQLPGSWIADDTAINGISFIPSPGGLAKGPGKTTFLTGLPITNDMGMVSGYTEPGINYSTPVDVENFEVSAKASTEIIYQAFGHGHMMTTAADISGVAREVLQNDAAIKLGQYEDAITSAMEQIVKVLLIIDGKSEYIPTIELRKSGTYMSPETRTQLIAEYNTGLLSKATVMASLGTVTDVDAELALIEQEAAVNLSNSLMMSQQGLMDQIDGTGQEKVTGKVPEPTQVPSSKSTQLNDESKT